MVADARPTEPLAGNASRECGSGRTAGNHAGRSCTSPRPVAFQTLEIIALFLVGPGLLVDVIGSLFPRAFDHTPFMGRGVGPISIVGLVVFGVLAGRRLLQWRGTSTPAEPGLAATTPADRVAGIVGRAREDSGA